MLASQRPTDIHDTGKDTRMSALSDILARREELAKRQPRNGNGNDSSSNSSGSNSHEPIITAAEATAATEEAGEAEEAEEVCRETFIAIYTPFLQNPTSFNPVTFRAYKDWLLYPSYYVLNTFPRFNVTRLAQTLIELHLLHNRKEHPATALYRVAMLIWDIELTVPASYMEEFERIALEEYIL